MIRVLFALVLGLLVARSSALAQSQAANGAIEGTIGDTSGGVLPGVTVTVTNTDNGKQRSAVTNEDGFYRPLLLPLGAYRVVAELAGFKTFEQTGVRVIVGATAVVNATLEFGAVSETVTVSAADLPTIDLARIDIGHTMSDLEVHSLPLVARNPYNFALVQPGVTGYENIEFGVPRLAANGQAMRINYQIDGNTNTEKDRAGLRLLPMSEVMIEQVKVVTTGFAPEFGQAMGMVYNAITPSGTNAFRGQASYLFRRNAFSAFPFFFGCGSTTPAANCPALSSIADRIRPATKVDTGTASLGGPILRNRLFFYGGWEQTRRDLSASRLITASPAVVDQLGLRSQPAAAPNIQTAKFAIGKVDYQLNDSNRLTARWIRFANDAPYNAGTGGGATLERQTNFLDGMHSTSAQLVTTLGPNRLNELRVQYAQRHQQSMSNEDSGSGPAINIAAPIVAFGGPYANTGQDSAGFDFQQKITQVVDNFTYVRGNHSYKFGVDWQYVVDQRVAAPQFLYTFPTAAAYLAARSGAAPFGYTAVTQLTGDRSFEMSTHLFSAFVQDDWQVAPRVKLLYGLRYDLYQYPDGLVDAPLAQTRSFIVDRNNIGPRVGVAWALSRDSVLRASSGLMFDQPILGGYEQALQLSGSPRAPIYTFSGAGAAGGMTPGAPAFPSPVPTGTLSQQSPWAVDPDFHVAHTWQTNVQYERSIGRDFTLAVGAMYARGWQLPVVTDVNLINPTGTLADGRPIYAAAVNAATRLDPRFNHVNQVQSIGESTFRSMTIQATRRLGSGLTFNAQYALGKAIDNAPLLTQLTVQSENGRSDPTDLDRDKGPNPLDMRHNFTGSLVFVSSSGARNPLVRQLLAGNEIGVLFAFNSGLPATILSNRDLNGDGITNNDRPAFVGRGSLYMPTRKNVDLRYTRWIPLGGTTRGEIIAELKNAFNIRQLQTVNTTIVTDALGIPAGAIPTDAYQLPNPLSTSFEQRKFQLGFRVRF
jgi:hypothetical protein